MKFIRNLSIIAALSAALLPGEIPAQERYPPREIMRPLILEYLMVEADMGFMWINTDRAFDDDGDLRGIDADYTEMTGRLDLTFSLAENMQLGVGIPYIFRELDSPGNPSIEGFGDLDATVLLQIKRETIGRPTSVVIGARGIFPIGASEVGDPDEFTMGAPARGANAVGPIIMIKETYWNKVALLTSFEWDFYFENNQKIMGQTVDTDYGDVMIAGLEPIFEVSDHISIWFSLFYTSWFKSEFELNGIKIDEYGHAFLFEMRPAIELQFGAHFDIFFGTAWKMMGENTFGGWPIWANMEVRF